MRILLIEPAKSPISMAGEDVFLFESLALEYVAAGVSADHDVRILDQRIDDTVEQTLEEYRPDVVGITGYTVHANRMKLLAERAKTWNPEVLTVVGGHHATVAPHDFESPHIDLVVVGEGVNNFREVVRRFNVCEGFDGIPGVWVNTDRPEEITVVWEENFKRRVFEELDEYNSAPGTSSDPGRSLRTCGTGGQKLLEFPPDCPGPRTLLP